MSGSAYCNPCETLLNLEDDVEERKPPQQPEASYHCGFCGFCGSSDLTIRSLD